MVKSMLVAGFVLAGVFAGAQDSTHHKVMKAEHKVHHAAVHAGRWVNHHVSAPHDNGRRQAKVHHNMMHAEHTVHHAAVHAGSWIDHHVSAPHKHPGQ